MPPAPSRGDDSSAEPSKPPTRRHRIETSLPVVAGAEKEKVQWMFRLGVGVMVASYLVYPLIGAVLLLPLSAESKGSSVLVAWAISWTTFTVGATLAGREGVVLATTFFRRRRRNDESGR